MAHKAPLSHENEKKSLKGRTADEIRGAVTGLHIMSARGVLAHQLVPRTDDDNLRIDRLESFAFGEKRLCYIRPPAG